MQPSPLPIDANGFRNRPEALLRKNDLILLGDFFGAGSSSTQDDTLAAVWERDHGLTGYSLSVGANGPWQEFMTLQYEYDTIPRSRDATILRLLFEGNDLDDRFHSDTEPARPGWTDRLGVRFEVSRAAGYGTREGLGRGRCHLGSSWNRL